LIFLAVKSTRKLPYLVDTSKLEFSAYCSMDYLRGGGVEYTGTLQVTSGSVVGTAEFTVSSGSDSGA